MLLVYAFTVSSFETVTEPDCAVRAALSDGTLSRQRWLSYQKLSVENAYAADTEEYLAQKKDKFKNIAKINKLNRKK